MGISVASGIIRLVVLLAAEAIDVSEVTEFHLRQYVFTGQIRRNIQSAPADSPHGLQSRKVQLDFDIAMLTHIQRLKQWVTFALRQKVACVRKQRSKGLCEPAVHAAGAQVAKPFCKGLLYQEGRRRVDKKSQTPWQALVGQVQPVVQMSDCRHQAPEGVS